MARWIAFNWCAASTSSWMEMRWKRSASGNSAPLRSLPRSGAEFPLAERFHRISIQLLVDAAHQLNAIHRAIAADYGVEHNLSFHAFVDQSGRILRIDLP